MDEVSVTTRGVGVGLLAAGLATAAVAAVVVLREPPPPPAPLVVSAPEPPVVPTPEATPAVARQTPPRRQPAAPPKTKAGIVPAPTVPSPPTAPPPVDAPATAAAPPTSTPPVAATEPPRYVPVLADTPPPQPPVSAPPEVPDLEELTVPKHSVIGIRLDVPVSSRTARIEDRITATISRDVQVHGRIAVAEGARLEGTIVQVEQGGKFRQRPRLGLRFDTLILTDGTRLSIKTDTIFREGASPSADATAKVGAGAVVGGILGAVLGGKTGAAIGSAAGGAAGAATVMQGDGEQVALRAGASLTVRLTDDLVVQIQR